jgi:hypothetical protein
MDFPGQKTIWVAQLITNYDVVIEASYFGHYQLALTWLSQRFKDIPKGLSNIKTNIFSFSVME